MSTMSMETFATHIQAMRFHYKSGLGSYDGLDATVISNAEGQVIPDKAKAAIIEFEGATLTFQDNNQKVLTQNSRLYIETKDKRSFNEKMEEARRKAKKDAEEGIDKVFDALSKAGEDNPSAREAILLTTIKVIDFFQTSVLGPLLELGVKLIQKISEWLLKAFQYIDTFFGETTKQAVDFFANLFSKSKELSPV
jgi:hypothetical protein